MFSRTCQYALQAVLYIAIHSQKDKKIGLREIAESQSIPQHFLSKILQTLVKQKILISIKGPNGGFGLNVAAEELSLLTIVEIIDGLAIFEQCGIGLKSCSDLCPCPIHQEFKVVKRKIMDVLVKKTVAELCMDVRNNKSIVSFNRIIN